MNRIATESHLVDRTNNSGHLARVSWGALFAGLAFTLATAWLLYTLGAAIGVSIVDVSDAAAVGQGLGIGSIIWMALSTLVAFFLGALLTAHLSGEWDRLSGLLHGATLWALATIAAVVLGYFGFTTAIQSGVNALKTTASSVGAAASNVGSGLSGVVGSVADQFINDVQNQMKKKAAELAAANESEGGAQVTESEVNKAIDNLDADTIRAMASAILSGNTEEARNVFSEATGLAQAEVESLVSGFSTAIQEELGTADNNQGLGADIAEKLRQRVSSQVAAADAEGGPQVSQSEVSNAMQQLDAQAMQSIGVSLLKGDTDAAKNTLADNTDLSEAQINDLVEGVQAEIKPVVDKYQRQASEYLEKASSYTQAVLWSTFVIGVLGLLACIIGGITGASMASRRRTLVADRTTTTV